jgi:Ca2+-binding RTX toxin-like protein
MIPALPTRPAPNTPLPISLNGPYSVAAGTTLYREGDWGDAGFDFFYSASITSSLDNAGTIWIRGTERSYALRAFGIDSVTNSGTIIAETIDGEAKAIFLISGFQGNLVNSGTIMAFANGTTPSNRAIAVSDWSPSSTVTNSGTIAAQWNGTLFSGYALQRNNGGLITNTATGSILAEGHAAIAVLTRAFGDGPTDLVNAGRIEAVSTTTANSVGVYIKSDIFLSFDLVNSGIIKGDWAIYANSYESSPPAQGIEVIRNLAGGQIIGDIFLDLGNDRIENAGLISGYIEMGDGNDLIDNRNGAILGVSYMCWGADTYLGSASADYVQGEWGDDVLEGGGGRDLLIGDYGDDRLVGGAGNDGLYGSYGNDTLVTLEGDIALGGNGNDRIELGDYTFWLADGENGFDTLVLPNANRLLDLSAALATGAIFDFEAIELRGGVEIVIRAADVVALTGSEIEFLITGTATDKVDLVGGWAANGTRLVGGTTYSVFTLSGVNVLVGNGLASQILGTAPGGAIGLDPATPGKGAPLPGAVAGTGLIPDTLTVQSFYISSTFEVEAGTTWQSLTGVYAPVGLEVFQLETSGTFLNNGAIRAINTGTYGYTVFDSGATGIVVYALSLLTNNGTIYAEAATHETMADNGVNSLNIYGPARLYNNEFGGLAMGIQARGSGPVANYGLIEARGRTGAAIGVQAEGFISPTGNTVFNQGQIRAQSDFLAAVGVFTIDNGKVWNTGSITAQGAIYGIGVLIGSPSGTVRNDGTITAITIGPNAKQSVGIWIDDNSGGLIGATFVVINNGTITAQNAVYVGKQSHEAVVDVTNSGLMTGGMSLGAHADVVRNTGTIGGTVLLGAGNDTFDGRGGTQSGRVLGGDGNDTLYGGTNADRLEGGAGDDTIDGGGGNDLLIGGGGNDVFSGGAGNDTFWGDSGTSDVVRYSGNRADYLVETVVIDGTTYTRVTGQGASAGDGVDLLRRIESIQFADTTLALNAVSNNRPALGPAAMPDQSAPDVALYTYQVPANAFVDPDPDDAVIYRAVLADGSALPGWLIFDPGTRTLSGAPPEYAIGSVWTVRVFAKEGNPDDPNFEVFDDFVLTITMAPGADQVGTPGNDWLQGNFRINRLFGLEGDDTLIYSAGPDVYDGGPGNDTLHYGGLAPITIQLGAVTGQFLSIENVYATEFDDTVNGDGNANFISGNGGNDALYGNGGNDIISGDDGLDQVFGGDGDDVLEIKYASGVTAGEVYDGGSGFDRLRVETGSFQIDLTSANLVSIEGIEGWSALLSLTQLAQFQRLELNNLRLATGGSISLSGVQIGAEFIALSDNATEISLAGAIRILSEQVFNVFGGAANDTITGSNQADILYGEDGHDVIAGNGGIDTLSGGAGNDRLVVSAAGSGSHVDGGTEVDVLAVSGAVTLGTVAGIEAIELTGGAALTLTGAQVSSGFILATAVTGTGSLTFNMTDGLALLTKLWSIAPGIAVAINGTSGTDIMKLGNVVQTANGGDGIDQIKGGSAVDTINGGAGTDKINGAGGADILTGGAGNDVFKYANVSDSGLSAAADRITDYSIGQDRLNFVNIDANAALAGDQAFTFLGTAAFAATGLGQLRYLTSGADLIVQADVNGDGVADMEVVLQGIGGQVLTGADFVL